MKHCLPNFRWVITIILLTINIVAIAKTAIHGVNGEILKNIQKRLDNLYLQTASPSTALINHHIHKAIEPYGYFNSQISHQNKIIDIHLGTPVKISTIQLSIKGPGKPLFRHVDILIKAGDIFKNELYEKTKQNLLAIAEENGYLNASFTKSEVLIFKKRQIANITIKLDTGSQHYFSHFNFHNSKYSSQFIGRYLRIASDTPYSSERLIKINNDLSGSGYFNKVNIKSNITPNNTNVPVDIFFIDKPSQTYSAGIGYANDTGIRGRLGWQWLRVTNTGHKFQTMMQGSKRENAFQAQYIIPGQDPASQQFHLSSHLYQLRYPVGRSIEEELSAGYRTKKEKIHYSFSINALQAWTKYNGRSQIKKQLLYPRGEFLIRKISSPLFSRRGYSLKAKAIAATGISDQNTQIIQGQLSGKVAWWFPTHTRLLLHGDIALTITPHLFEIPLSMQLLSGGTDSIRGYTYQSIGPGKRLITTSIEVQQAFKENWYLVGYLDQGDVYHPQKLQLRKSIGLGIMWTSPVGPIRISVARAMAELKNPYRLILSMGPDL